MNSRRGAPSEPRVDVDVEGDMNHAIGESGGHGTHEGAVFDAIPGAHHPGALREDIIAEATIEDEGVKRLLHIGDGAVELVDEEEKRLVAEDRARRTELGHHPIAIQRAETRDADEILGRDLGAEESDADETEEVGGFADEGALADPGRAPDKGRSLGGEGDEKLYELGWGEREHGEAI
jgi:hypothetical protein